VTPAPRPLQLPVGGMTCAACVAHVDRALRAVDGVKDVSVNLITRTATVTQAADAAPPSGLAERLVSAVEKAGYTAHVPADDDDVLAAQRDGDRALAEEATDRRRRATVALVAAAACMWLSMPLMHGSGDDRLAHWLMGVMDPPVRALTPWLFAIERQTLLAVVVAVFVPILAVVAAPIFRRAWRALTVKSTDMHTLIALGVLASLLSTAIGEIAIDGALFITGFVLLGQGLEARARGEASAALSALATLQPDVAHLVADPDGAPDDVREVGVADLRVGDVVVVKPGARVPGDGVVTIAPEDGAHIAESHLTGEPAPVRKKIGDVVRAGSVNGAQPVRLRLTHLGADSTLHQLMRLLRDAQGRRAEAARLADRVASVFVPAMIVLAAAVFGGWAIAVDVDAGVRFATAVLVVACPCAMGLAVPVAVVTATGRAAQEGVLIKGGDVLERLATVDAAVFDKTGTLTSGFTLVGAFPRGDGVTGDQVLALAAGLETDSEHPIAKLIVAEAKRLGVRPRRVREKAFREGQGIVGAIDGKKVAIGNERLMAALHVPAVPIETMPQALDAFFVSEDDVVIGGVAVSERARAGAGDAVRGLGGLGISATMLTGDQRARALSAARTVDLSEADVVAEVLPADKLAHIEGLRAQGRRVMFVGDGVNDAAALAAATVGVAIGEGTAVAGAAADAVLLSPSLEALPRTIAVARRAVRVMKQNLAWAFGYNLVMLPLAAGALSSFGVALSPALASVAMAASSVTVVLNALRLRVR